MLGSLDQLARAHSRRLRLAVLPIAAAATVITVVGKGLGWRIGGIAILATVTIWTYILYFMADQRCEKMQAIGTTSSSAEPNATQLHHYVCETTEYWDYLHDLLTEVANTSIPELVAEPVELPAASTDLGQGFVASERMMREFLDHIIPPSSRYVAYYILNGGMQASSEIHNGWKGRPPDLRSEPLRHNFFANEDKAWGVGSAPRR